jgi:MYXO-CTERM domain-containing protein
MQKNAAMLVFVSVALLLVAPSCAIDPDVSSESQGIIGGTAVGGDAYPAVGGVLTNAGSICTGTLISPTAVLTAAHCVEPELLKLAMQQAGQDPPEVISYQFTFARDLRAASDGEKLEVSSVEWHAQFIQDLDDILNPGIGQWDDIAVMHLAAPVTDRPSQRLAPTDVVEALEMDRMYAVSGYGMTDDQDPMSAGVLHEGQSGLDEVAAHEIAAGDGDDQQACRGDSGGPIFADDSDTYQIGIASRINATGFTGETPRCNTGLLYTRIDPYLAWIADRVPDLGEGAEDEDDEDGEGDQDGDGEDGDDSGGCAVGGDTTGAGAALALFLIALLIAYRRRYSSR